MYVYDVCMYVCMCVYIYIHIDIYRHIYIVWRRDSGDPSDACKPPFFVLFFFFYIGWCGDETAGSPPTLVKSAPAFRKGAGALPGTHFTCFTGTKVN